MILVEKVHLELFMSSRGLQLGDELLEDSSILIFLVNILLIEVV